MKKSLLAVLTLLVFNGTFFYSEAQILERFKNTYIPGRDYRTDAINLNDSTEAVDINEIKPLPGLAGWCLENNIAYNLEAAFLIGTGGLGLELATPVTNWARLRAGIEWIPPISIPMRFDIASFNNGTVSNDITHIQEMLYDMTGLKMDKEVRMTAKSTMFNFKLLVDVFPLQENRHWHVTAGFYVGAPVIGKAVNSRNQMPTLVAINLYNRAYDYFTSIKDIYDVPIGGGNYLDPDQVTEWKEKFEEYGRIGIHIGDYKDGKPYLMVPSKDGYVRAKARTNSFKPYIGFGYSGALDRMQKWNVGVEAGILIWGGAPQVITHDGVNISKELTNVRGKVGAYLDFMNAVPVFPLVNFKISYSFF